MFSFIFFVILLACNWDTGDIGTGETLSGGLGSSVSHSPIFINGDSELDAFCAGNGTDGLTPATAHVIENYEIDGSGLDTPIHIRSTTRYLIIRNCTLSNSGTGVFDAGIRLYHCQNVKIVDCVISTCNFGIFFDGCTNNTIENVSVSGSFYDGIYFDLSSNFNTINNSIIDGNSRFGIFISSSENNSLVGNNVTMNGDNGIHLTTTNNTLIVDNYIYYNSKNGIFLMGTGSLIYRNTFSENNLNSTPQAVVEEAGNMWDNGSIGNYWSDYTIRYPNATDIGGIWDVPYEVNTTLGELDNFPLVNPPGVGGNAPPIITNCTTYIEYQEGSTGNFLEFSVIDDDSSTGTYEVTGPMLDNGSWTNDTIVQVSVDGFVQGVYYLNLTVWDDVGLFDWRNITVNVTAPDLYPVADFYANVTSILVGEWVQFTFNGSEGDPPATFTWAFGDGGNSSLRDPVYRYMSAGVYTVSLDVWDADMDHDVEIKTSFIVVSAGNTPPIIINESGYVIYQDGTTGNQIWFNVNDAEDVTGTWTITGSLTASGNWTNNTAEFVNVDGLPVGLHELNLTVFDGGALWDSVLIQVNVTVVDLIPIADFYANATNISVGDWVQFTFNGSAGDLPATYLWNFGDNGTSSAQNPVYQYLSEGIFNVTLTVVDLDGDADLKVRMNYIIVSSTAPGNTPPTIVLLNTSSTLVFHFSEIGASLDFRVDDAEQVFGNYTVGNASFELDRGTWSNGSAISVSLDGLPVGLHAFDIFASDTEGASSNLSITVNVLNDPPLVNFTWHPEIPLVGEAVVFEDLSSDTSGDIVSWYWDFGDGSTSTDQNPIHIYSQDGSYIVRLTVTDEYGANATHERAINISSQPAPPPQEEIPGYELLLLLVFSSLTVLAIGLYVLRKFKRNA
ncbi:MAG: PKD domain-containing protein [Promethearchaeota archaeon]